MKLAMGLSEGDKGEGDKDEGGDEAHATVTSGIGSGIVL